MGERRQGSQVHGGRRRGSAGVGPGSVGLPSNVRLLSEFAPAGTSHPCESQVLPGHAPAIYRCEEEHRSRYLCALCAQDWVWELVISRRESLFTADGETIRLQA